MEVQKGNNPVVIGSHVTLSITRPCHCHLQVNERDCLSQSFSVVLKMWLLILVHEKRHHLKDSAMARN